MDTTVSPPAESDTVAPAEPGVEESKTESPFDIDITEVELPETPSVVEGCIFGDGYYEPGSPVADVSPCQESCLCVNGSVDCVMRSCPPAPPSFLRCLPVITPDKCCPSYNCRKFIKNYKSEN